MDKVNWLKYSAFILAFIILFLPNNTNAWIWISILAGILLLIWILKTQGSSNFLLYVTLVFTILIFISDIHSTEQKWFIWLGSISLFIWTISWLWNKWE